MEIVLVNKLFDGYFQFVFMEDYLFFIMIQEGLKECKEIYEVLELDDCQLGWCNCFYLVKYDLKIGLLQLLIFGYYNVWVVDIFNDGWYFLMMISQSCLIKCFIILFLLYWLDMQILQVELLIDKDGFISGVCFLFDGMQVLVFGLFELLGGIGKNVKEGQILSMMDGQFYLLNIVDKRVILLMKDFNFSVQCVVWNKVDG